MSSFSPGQRVTASQLNSLQDAANEGLYSNTDIINGKIVNSPTSLQYKQLYSAPRFLDTKYGMANVHFEGEADGINQHLYICLIDPFFQCFRNNGLYYSYNSNNSIYAICYDDGNDNIASRLVSYQDFDLNTDLQTRQMDMYIFPYVPHTNYDGYIETPIPPDTNVHLQQLGIYNSDKLKVGTVFLILGLQSGELSISQQAVEKLKQQIIDSGVFGQLDTIELSIEAAFTLIYSQKVQESSRILNTYQNIIGAYQIDNVSEEPWSIDQREYNYIKQPIYQIGVQTNYCSAYEDENYEIHTLDLSSPLSARLGVNYCVIDVPRLSAYHTWEDSEHPLSSSPNFNPAYQVAMPVFEMYEFKEFPGSTIKNQMLTYIDHHPTAPCWQVYPF